MALHPPTIPAYVTVLGYPALFALLKLLQLGIIKPSRGTKREGPQRCYITAAVPALQAAPGFLLVFFSFSFSLRFLAVKNYEKTKETYGKLRENYEKTRGN